MALEISSDKVYCSRCGRGFSRRRSFFLVSYAAQYKGIGFMTVCNDCIDSMYDTYLAQCHSAKNAVRQMCRKLDLYWDDAVYESVLKRSTTKSIMTQYLAVLRGNAYAGMSYDDTLIKEESLWSFTENPIVDEVEKPEDTIEPDKEDTDTSEEPVSEDIVAFWGIGYTPTMYRMLEQRRSYWMSKFDDGQELDIGTEAILRQICSLELDINRDRAAGKSVEKNINALNTLLGSANLKPVQKKQDDADTQFNNTPMGVWLQRWEYKRPLPEIDEDCKDVNGLRKYVFTWMGHLCKMLGLKNGYSKLYEDEIERLRVEKPEFNDEDDEEFMMDLMNESVKGISSNE